MGLHRPEFKAKVVTALDMKGSWKRHPNLVYSVAREAAEAWMTVEQTEQLRRVQSRPKGTLARVGSANEEKITVDRTTRTGVESSIWRFEAVWQLLQLREGGSQDG